MSSYNIPGVDHNLTESSYKSKKIKKCKHCCTSFENTTVDIANHTRWCKENPKNAKLKHGKTIECCSCGIQFSLLRNNDRRITCSKRCAYARTNEQKTHLSNLRKKFLSENPDKHPWRSSTKNKSTPCENVKQYLTNKQVSFIEEYKPLNERFFSIDIAFPNLKIGIEINGNQHYNLDGTLARYYQERHDLIESAGWKLLEIHYTRCFDELSIGKIFDFDFPIDSNDEIERIKYMLNRTITPKIIKNRGQKIRLQTDSIWAEKKDIIFDHNINFQKFGWVSKVSKVLNISTQNVCKWMKRYHSEFYKTCFHKK